MHCGYDTASGRTSVSKSIKSEFDVKRIFEKIITSKLVIPECSHDKKNITIATGSEHDASYNPGMIDATNYVPQFADESPCDKKSISIAIGSDSTFINRNLVNNGSYL